MGLVYKLFCGMYLANQQSKAICLHVQSQCLTLSIDPKTAFWYTQSGGEGYQNLVYDSFSQSGNDFHAAKALRPLGGSATGSTAPAKVGQTVLALVCYVVEELCFSLSLSLSL
jgi:hypothetical protein